MAEVAVMVAATEKVKLSVQRVKDQAQGIVDMIDADKKIANVKLEAAIPALMEAEAALQVTVCLEFLLTRRS